MIEFDLEINDLSQPLIVDTETVGFHGPIALVQFAFGLTGEIHLWCPWKKPVQETLALLEMIASHPAGIIGFNLAFDWFHVAQMYTTLLLIEDKSQWLEDCLPEYVAKEEEARSGPCIKPVKACDLMLHARRGPYQSTMDRGDVRVKRIPTALAYQLANELETRIPFKDLYFARKADPRAKHWQVYDIKDDDEQIDPNWKDIVCKFAPTSALKALHADIFGTDMAEVLKFKDVDLPEYLRPDELGFAPFAAAVERQSKVLLAAQKIKKPLQAWPLFIRQHASHWSYNSLARKYAADDVKKTRDLYKYFGSPDLDDDDSELACMVGVVRWHGFSVDLDKIAALREQALQLIQETPIAHTKVRPFLDQFLEPVERLVIQGSTKKVILEDMLTWQNDEETGEHKIVPYVRLVLAARKAKKQVELYDKIIIAGRFHVSAKVIGALSGRMSGADDLNAQGINKLEEIRECFTLADGGLILSGGDFSGFEVTLADAVYADPDLREDLLSGKKIHALFGQYVFPDLSYDQILESEGTADDKYTKSKSAVFAMLYGGEGFTLKERLGVEIEIADAAYQQFVNKYKKVGEERRKVFEMFCSMRQPGGIGSKVEWHEPQDKIETIFGFPRYFTLENQICKALFELAEKPPKSWTQIKIKVTRRDREQSVAGACRSALFASAFALQASNMRAAANHVIQGSGAFITKFVQRSAWNCQPSGVHYWVVLPFNIHDEIEAPTHPDHALEVKAAVDAAVESLRPIVPLIKLKWDIGLSNWSEKG